MKVLKHALLISLVLALSACGFQPRGAIPQLTQIPTPLYISGVTKYTPLHRELVRQLEAAGIKLTEDGPSAASMLRIADQSSDSRVFTVDSLNNAAEYELEESFRFSVRAPEQGELIADQRVRVVRLLLKPDSQVLAGQREEKQLRIQMRRDLVSRMLTRIKAQR